VVGLGHVGSRVAKRCANAGARLLVSDVDTAKRHVAEQLDARWIPAGRALEAEVDVLVPCALGGIFDDESVPRLRCPIVAGAANNQLATDTIAEALAARRILWAPDFVVNAGGIINIAEELVRYDAAAARRRVRGIADTLRQIFDDAQAAQSTPLRAAMDLARKRLGVAGQAPEPVRSRTGDVDGRHPRGR
jgi:leucine dehydrogenase